MMVENYPARNPLFEGIELGVGTWSWGDRMLWGFGSDYKEIDLSEAFYASLSAGITFFDTAEVYGQGRSEEILGNLGQQSGKQFIVASKFMPYPWRVTRSSLTNALKGSLKRLKRNTMDLYQIHWPWPPLTIETWMEALAETQQSGMVRALGVSNYSTNQLLRAQNILSREGINLASNQVEFNLVNRKIEKNGLLTKCQEMGVTVIAYSPLAMGILAGKYSQQNPPPGIRRQRFNPKYLARVQPLLSLLRKIGANHAGKTPAQVAINWVICKGAIPIPGAKTRVQMEQNVGAAGWRLNDEEIAQLDEASDKMND
jgi:aryl-alcohol dehydrogenase-like predicted oxidoreductase